MNLNNFLNELFAKGNHNIQDKMKKKKINRLKRLKKCSGNMTPSVITQNGQIRVVCTPKDRKRAKLQKRIMRLRKSKVSSFKKSLAKSHDTKKFRNIIK